MKNQREVIKEYRNIKLEGRFIDLIPISESDLSEVIRIRNQPKSIYFFNQNYKLTLDMQKSWFEKYLFRDNDLYWGIHTKDGRLIGTQRLYDISDKICEQGSTVLDEAVAAGGPYAAEAILLSIRFAFDKLNVEKIINDNRFDNKNMNSISKKVGFTFLRERNVKGIKYLYYELSKENFNEVKLQKTINNWLNR